MSRFAEKHDLNEGLAILSSFSTLELGGKSLLLIVDVTDVVFNKGNMSQTHKSFLKALHNIATQNAAIVIRVADTMMGITCYSDDGVGGYQEYTH